MNWKHGIGTLGLLLAVGIIMTSFSSAEEADFEEATVHLSPDCGCCIQHAQYLERAGVDVEVIEHNNYELNQLFAQIEVPENYKACHITELEDENLNSQTVVGHVPVDVFNEVVEERPEGKITLPGMPQGSPGMPGAKDGEWVFHELNKGEVVGEFTKR